MPLRKYFHCNPGTMMSTVQFLWVQKGENDERLSQAEMVIDSLNKEIEYLGVLIM